ncbi:helix-turn-helix transcriptional regulator [Paractinoplanes ferrugineus]|uniref:Transcriptional regulator n=1 Tax=Paractinoplanes ferrugineus TaxID=113564 RepID=A0A919J6S6_9ACTN|nr:helix-turn-helix transcriptional regulator [Actinoplanes ferrugineus]GIE15098.1 transcriptional regulator [Actinoplanes ferrugineus]
MARAELARFLRNRRERLRPADAGPRRTPGLRREEVAALAHMSVDYYVRLEQARGPHPSPRILDGISHALGLDPAERRHLFHLAGATPTAPAGPSTRVRPHVAALLDRIPGTAAVVTAANYDVLAWNPLAGLLLGYPVAAARTSARPNLARRRFLGSGEPPAESSATEEFGVLAVARLRAAADRYPRDPGLGGLLAELRAGSPEFVALWDTDPVRSPGHRRKTISHAELGDLEVNCDVLTVPDDDQQVVFITADPGSLSERTLRRATLLNRAEDLRDRDRCG